MTNVRFLLSTLAFAILFVGSSTAQIFFTETFEGTMGANGIPAGWTETGLSTDGIFVVGDDAAASSAYITAPVAIQGTKFAFTNDDACNCDKSEDRLILPMQNFTGMVGVNLYFDQWMDAVYGGSGTVEVSTTGTAGPWTTVYTMTSTAGWVNDVQVNLSAYAGNATVYIAFRYNDGAVWADALGIDDVKLEQIAVLTPEVGISSVTPGEYTLIPVTQATSFPVSATVNNTGAAAAANITLTTNVYKLPNTTTAVYTGTGSTTNLAVGANAVINLATPFVPAAPAEGSYAFEHVISGDVGGNTTNDTFVYVVDIDSITYARDNGSPDQGIGANPGTAVTVGNNFTLNSNASLDSVLFFVAPGVAGVGDTCRVIVAPTTAGVPNNTGYLGQSAIYVFTPADTVAVLTLPVRDSFGGQLVLAPGTYFIGIEKFASGVNYGLQCSDEIFTENTVYANLNGGAYATLNSLLAGFDRSPIIRGFFHNVCNLTATTNATNATCTSGTGSATVTPANGTAPYVYTWSNGQTSASINNLVAGTYNVTLTDQFGCSFSTSVSVGTTNTTITTTTPTTTNSACGGATGSASVNPNNGTAPYTYIWTNGGTTQTINNIAAGGYGVTITDANGCVGVVSQITVNNPNSPVASISNQNNNACNGDANGSATATATGGTSPYSYNWTNGNNTDQSTGLAAGVYSVTVTDAASCANVTSVTITEPSALSVTANATATADVSCFGGNNGAAGVAAAGGTPTYSYTWSNGGNTASITGLTAGTYDVTVTDNNSCVATIAVTVSEPASALSVTGNSNDISCNGSADGDATASAAGGTSPYSYSWSNGSTGATVNGLTAGQYSVTATDANGCVASVSALTVTEPTALNVGVTATDASAFGSTDGAVNVEVGGGTGAYSYTWSNGATTEDLNGVAAGTYTVTVTDGNGCTDTASGIVDQPSTIGVSNSSININVFPNPADKVATLTITLANSSDVTIEVTNVTGQVLRTINDANVLDNQYTLNTSEWAAGVYFVRVVAGNDTATYRLTKK